MTKRKPAKALKTGDPINLNWIDANDLVKCHAIPHQNTSHVSNQLLLDCGKDGVKVGRFVKYISHVFDAGKARNPGEHAYFDNHGNEISNCEFYYPVEYIDTTKREPAKK